MSDHIAKPIQVAELIDKVSRWSSLAATRFPANIAAI
jgi:hypothetical protein